MIRFSTAGESHGEALIALVSGIPAGVPVDLDFVNHELWRRQQGYGRGGRMKIEHDRAEIVSGVRHSHTIGSPIAILIRNRDWQNWTEALPVEDPGEDMQGAEDKKKPVTRPRPGHADLAGAIKYNFHDARYILERASARETTARVALGA
ncbi:MAG: chorismate synthase, partial [Terracidiphilus sp.]